MKLNSLLESDERKVILDMQQQLIDNEYGVDLNVELVTKTGLHVTLPSFVDELLVLSNGTFQTRSTSGPLSFTILGKTVDDAVRLFLPERLGFKLKAELQANFGSAPDIYAELYRDHLKYPIVVNIEWDHPDEQWLTIFTFDAKQGIFLADVKRDGKFVHEDEPIHTIAAAIDFAKNNKW